MNVVYLPVDSIDPNPWNPNRMDERSFNATVQSLAQYGFTIPILVRAVADDRYEIIDGEHRWKGLRHMRQVGLPKGAVPDIAALVEAGTVPAHVMEMTDAMAKRLTIVMNETHGAPDDVEMGRLLADLQHDFTPEELLAVIPYDPGHLDDLIAAAARIDADALGEVQGEDPAAGAERAEAKAKLADRFGLPPFTVLNAREGWWQDRRRAWIALGIQSEVGRGEVK